MIFNLIDELFRNCQPAGVSLRWIDKDAKKEDGRKEDRLDCPMVTLFFFLLIVRSR